MSLKTYHKKRSFKDTPEPRGKVGARKRGRKLLYIIQKHAASHLHYDFRLALNGVLLSWAVPKGPSLDPTVKRLAMHVEDHPLAYGSFEGLIPKGQYGGGTVMLWDKGEWIPEDADPEKAYKNGNMTFTLKAKKLNGRWKLIRIQGNDKTWLLFKIQDDYAKPLKKYDILKAEPNSVKSGSSIDEIAEKCNKDPDKDSVKKVRIKDKSSTFPKNVKPALATLVDAPPAGKSWCHEIKFDGYRILAFKHKGKIELRTRNGINWTKKFASIAHELQKFDLPDCIFDGEVVILDDEQKSNFQLLQNAIKNPGNRPFIYYIFDLLYYDKANLMKRPLKERKEMLEKIIAAMRSHTLRYSDHVIGEGQQVFEHSCKLGLEGVVSKMTDSIYEQKRSKNWLKAKCSKRQEFIIAGFTPPNKNRQYFGSLLLGTYDKRHRLIYNGNVGTGFTAKLLKEIYQLLMDNQTSTMPFKVHPPKYKKITWVKPVLVAEVEFTEFTQDNIVRHPSFKGIRQDKKANEICIETPAALRKLSVTITNPDKIIYPEDKISKAELVDYYDSVKALMLPYVRNRPLTLLRCPQTYTQCFYQKHFDKLPPAFKKIVVREKLKIEHYAYITDETGLLTLPQLGVLETHSWGASVDDVNHPDLLIFDLDPGPAVKWKTVVEAALLIKKELARLKLTSFVKTTGGKGLHVVIPIAPEYNWDEVRNFADVFANYLATNHPDKYIAKMTKAKRVGKIYIDYLRNLKGATAIAPYSTRARLHAPLAIPVAWNELSDDYRDTFFTVKTISKRLLNLKRDPWRDFFKLKQSLNLKKFK